MNKAGTELVFDVVQDPDGGYTANCLNEDIFTEADSWDELRSNVKDAVAAFYFDSPSPRAIRLHLVRDELLTLA
ncbi:MAG: 2-phospho-L-lactate guanylyltransferase [Spirochaetes bacterium]|nr:2-phospho-L-lactate guanylyltransferase [Spirochaetota bacterium]